MSQQRRIIALVNAYNEAANIGRALRSIAGHVDEVHVFDGAYAQYPHANPASTDGTREIVERAGAVWHPLPNVIPWPDQIAKRTAMFDAVDTGDVCFILDADEVVANPEALDAAKTDTWDVGWARTFSNLYAGPYDTPRLIVKVPGLHYAGRHSWIFDGQQRLVASHQNMTTGYRHSDVPLRVWNLRDATREAPKAKFRNARNPMEAAASESAVYGGAIRLFAHPNRAGTPRRATEILKAPNKPWGTLVVPFSRPWALERWADAFRQVELPWDHVEIVAVADTNDARFAERVRNVIAELGQRANGARLFVTGNPKLPEDSKSGQRRARILAAWHVFLTEALGEVLIGAEDDTLPPPNAYMHLLNVAEKHGATFAQGTEIGRWNSPFVPHWNIHEVNGKIVKIEAGRRGNGTVQKIEGGGWYCFVCKTDAARQVEMGWTSDPPIGPDVWFVKRLHDRGHLCVGDWSVECTHFGQNFELHPATSDLVAITWEPAPGGWTMRREAIRGKLAGVGGMFYPAKGGGDLMNRINRGSRKFGVGGANAPANVNAPVELKAEVLIEAIRTFAGDEGFVTKGARRWTTLGRAKKLIEHGYAREIERAAPIEAEKSKEKAAHVDVDLELGIPVDDAKKVVAERAPTPVASVMLDAVKDAPADGGMFGALTAMGAPDVREGSAPRPFFTPTPRDQPPTSPNVFSDVAPAVELPSAEPDPEPEPEPEKAMPGEVLDARTRDSHGVPLRDDTSVSGSVSKARFPCKKCSKGFTNEASLAGHMRRAHIGGR